jgi:hypothetical protein
MDKDMKRNHKLCDKCIEQVFEVESRFTWKAERIAPARKKVCKLRELGFEVCPSGTDRHENYGHMPGFSSLVIVPADEGVPEGCEYKLEHVVNEGVEE